MIEARRFIEGVAESEPVDVDQLGHARRGAGTLLVVEVVDSARTS